MKTTLTIFIALLMTCSAVAQNIEGRWYGTLEIQSVKLSLEFNITKTAKGYSSTMDSPDQSATDIPVSTTVFKKDKLSLEIPDLGLLYTGELKEQLISGTLKQYGMEFPLDLKRERPERTRIPKPQEPEQPYPYHSEDVSFRNEKAGISLAGTLTLPHTEGMFPAVILISGSGPQNRDEEVLGHKPFLIISDHLTRNGIAVLRFDDRGVGESEGVFHTATSADFATDVHSAAEYLKTRKEIDKSKIGLAGHSEGGLIAPMVAAKNPEDISFLVLMAGTGLRGDKILLMQQELIGRASGLEEEDIRKTREINQKVFELVQQHQDEKALKAALTKHLNDLLRKKDMALPPGMKKKDLIASQLDQIVNPWMLHFLRFDPVTALEKVKCPVLAVNGDKDLQVPAEENLNAIREALKRGGNTKVEVIKFPGLNHLFQECETGSPDEYARIQQTFSPPALDAITEWIRRQTE